MDLIYLLIGFLIIVLLLNERNHRLNNNDKADSRVPPLSFSSCRKIAANQLINQVFNEHGFIKNQTQWNLHITCKDDYTSGKIKTLQITNPQQSIMGIDGKWTLGSKHKLWMALESYYGRRNAKQIMPNTYILDQDLLRLKSEFDPKKLYFLKKDIQRQKGLTLTRNLEQIKKARNQGYVLVQECLSHPYLYHNYKTNLRVYLLVICQGHSRKQAFVFQNALMSYGSIPYREPLVTISKSKKEELFDSVVASFYQSKSLYQQGFPITWDNFRLDLPHQGREVWDQVRQLLVKMMKATHQKLCNLRFKHKNLSFELFGVDIFLDQNLRPWLVEVNVGPGMNPNDTRDHLMRKKIYEDMFALVGLIPEEHPNRFELLWN